MLEMGILPDVAAATSATMMCVMPPGALHSRTLCAAVPAHHYLLPVFVPCVRQTCHEPDAGVALFAACSPQLQPLLYTSRSEASPLIMAWQPS